MNEYKGKRVLITGVGRHPLGSNNSAARFFARAGADVTVTDPKPARDLAEGLRHLKGLRARFHLGGYRPADFRGADIVIRNPGNRALEPFLAIARKRGARVTTDVGLFCELAPSARTIGITGTRGKSTTTALIGAMFAAAKKPARIGGNIRVSPLTFLPMPKRSTPTTVVIEFSSWLLEGFAAEDCAPRIAIVTNISPDHLNTYPSMRAYTAAKAEIFLAQGPRDAAVLNRDNAITRGMGRDVPGRRYWFSAKPFAVENGAFFRGNDMVFRNSGKSEVVARRGDIRHIPGEHNAMNALAAVCAAKLSGLSNRAVVKALRTFRGLPDRLEHVRDVKGIAYWNDTTATSPEGSIAALRALGGKGRKRIILIAGGADKELDFKTWAREVKRHAKDVILFEGSATPKVVLALRKAGVRPDEIVRSMRDALHHARAAAKRGDTVLLSPGCASFGVFTNEFDRGNQFRTLVQRLH